MVLKTAFNALTRLHSREATLKRLGNTTADPDLYSPARITPSNFFRFIEGPSQTVIHGREFVIPTDTLTGVKTQLITFDDVPSEGSFHLTYGMVDSASIAFDADEAAIQTALRAITGLEAVTVEGDFTDGFLVTFIGVQSPTLLVAVQEAPPLDTDITVAWSNSVPWSPLLKRGDRIVDTVYGELTIDEIMEIVDLGGSIMGYRVRSE